MATETDTQRTSQRMDTQIETQLWAGEMQAVCRNVLVKCNAFLSPFICILRPHRHKF